MTPQFVDFDFDPNWGLVEPLIERVRDRRQKRETLAVRAQRDFVAWLDEDLAMGSDTLGLIARLSVPPGDYDPDYEYSVSARIVELNLSGSHVMVTKEDYINGVLQKFDSV